jgi:hypothetical protein
MRVKLRWIIAGITAVAMFAGPLRALAQQDAKPEEIEKKRNAEALESRYQRALQNTSEASKPVNNDPWANMRAPSQPANKK